MKALISPNETFDLNWISSWEDGVPVYSEILDCQRVAEVVQTEFEVAQPLFWVDCPQNCAADSWYFKDNQVYEKPHDVPMPS